MFMSFILSPLLLFVPLSFIYQLVFAFKHFEDHPLIRKISLALVLCIIAGFIAVGPVSGLVQDIKASQDPDMIRNYLAEKYGEEFVINITIERAAEDPSHVRKYHVASDVLPAGDRFTVCNEPNPNDDHVYSDDLIDRFADENGPYVKSFSAYLNKEFEDRKSVV